MPGWKVATGENGLTPYSSFPFFCLEATARLGNHGIVFNVSQITLTDSERGRLRELHFGEAKSAHYEVNSKVVEVYDKMLAKTLPCVMMIGTPSH